MIYKQQEPVGNLKHFIKSFWMVDGEAEDLSQIQKIIPDGYPEMIFHYKDPFKANISGKWFLQDKYLVAGQIRNHFFLENTGKMGFFGIKLQPWTLKLLFNLDMSQMSDKVISIKDAKLLILKPILETAISDNEFEDKVHVIENWFVSHIDSNHENISSGQKATQYLIDKKGGVAIQEVLEYTGLSERSLERYFKTHIGLSPKFYSRILRFSNVFSLVEKGTSNWSDIAYLAGFFDQSHFIKNIKEFTGEKPSEYGFNEANLANFFLKK